MIRFRLARIADKKLTSPSVRGGRKSLVATWKKGVAMKTDLRFGILRRLAPIILIFFSSISVGQTTFPVRLDQFRKSIVFLYSSDATGQVDPSKPQATGFFVGVPLKSDPSKSFLFLITARHVVDPSWATCSRQSNPSKLFMRLNKKVFDPTTNQSGVEYVPLDLVREGQTEILYLDTDASIFARRGIGEMTPWRHAPLPKTCSPGRRHQR